MKAVHWLAKEDGRMEQNFSSAAVISSWARWEEKKHQLSDNTKYGLEQTIVTKCERHDLEMLTFLEV